MVDLTCSEAWSAVQETADEAWVALELDGPQTVSQLTVVATGQHRIGISASSFGSSGRNVTLLSNPKYLQK